MKKIACILFFVVSLIAHAQQITIYLVDTTRTNPAVAFSNSITLTMPGFFTNLQGYYKVTNSTAGDSLPLAFGKVGTNFMNVTNALATLRTNSLTLRSNYFNEYAYTNGMRSGDVTIANSNGAPLLITYGPVVGYYNLTATAAPGTNMVTAYNLSNAVFSSQQITLLNTNFTFASSNYLGKFTNVTTVSIIPPLIGGGGLTPPSAASYSVWYSTNNLATWTTNTPNHFTNVSHVAVTVSATGAGYASVYTVDHPELDERVNDMSRQIVRVRAPVDAQDAVNKTTMETAIANGMASLWQTASNGDYCYAPNNKRVFTLKKSVLLYSTNYTAAIVGTNFTVSLAVTNFFNGWQFQMSPAQDLVNGFNPISYYTLTTNSGIATFAVPLALLPADKAFFRIVSPQTAGVVSDWPIQTPYVWFGTNLNYTANTITSSTNSTLGYGAGLMTLDTNYVYISVGSNAWRRISIPTNTW